MNAETIFRLDGCTILVTGASSGIGRAIAIGCAAAGATVLVHGRDEARLAETREALAHHGHRTVIADLSVPEQLDAVADACPEIDGVVHSAGIHGVAPIRSLQADFLRRVFDINLFAPVMLTQRLLWKKRLRKGASVLFMSSIAAKAGKAGVGPYSGSKAALLGIMRPLALEVAKHGIRVNALCPGIVVTPLFAGNQDWLRDEVASSYPLGLGQPEDIAHAAVFYLSRASRKITGTAFSIDGGVTFI